MKKSNSILIIILILVIGSIYTLIHHGDISVIFLKKLLAGEYGTEICISNASDDGLGTQTAYCDGKYYYYDSEKEAVCEWESGEVIVKAKEATEWLGATDEYMYIAFQHSIHQYDYKGNEVAVRNFTENEDIKQMSFDNQNVYCEVVEVQSGIQKGDIYVFDKKDISKAGSVNQLTDEQENYWSFYEDGSYCYDVEYEAKRFQDFWLVTTGNQTDFEVDEAAEILKIQVVGEEEYLGLINSETMEPFISCEDKIMALADDRLYTAVNNLSCLEENGTWEDYSDSLNFSKDLFVAASTIEDNKLIVNLERYFREDMWYKSEYDTIGYLEESKIIYIDLSEHEVKNVIDVSAGSVVYMDSEKYAVMNGKKLVFYSVDGNQVLSTHRIKGLRMRKEWEVERCGEKLFFICDKEVVDCVEL